MRFPWAHLLPVEATELIKRPREYTVNLKFSEVAEVSRPVMEVITCASAIHQTILNFLTKLALA